MTQTRRAMVAGCVALLLEATGLAQSPPPTDDLAGIYLCEGAAMGMSYTAVVTISPSGEVWDLSWAFEPHGQAVGVGILKDGVLAVVYQLETGDIGLSVYTVRREGSVVRLEGRWTVPGVEGTFPETLTKTTKPLPAH